MTRYQEANELLVATWIRYQQFGELFDREGDYWAVIKLNELCEHDAPQAIITIIEILTRNQSDLIVEALTNGPLRDLLAHHGQCAQESLERKAASNPLFGSMLRSLQP